MPLPISGNQLTRRAAHATWWSALEIAARYGVQFAVTILLARLLAPSDFGLIAMLLVFTTVAALLVDSGFGTALVQKQRTSDDDETTVFLSGLCISAIVGCILWLAAPAIAAFYSQPILTPLTRLSLFVLPLSALAAVPDALLTQRLDFRARANAEIIASLCSGAVAVSLAWRGFGVWSLAWQSIVAIGARAALLWRYSGWRPRGRFNPESFRTLFSFGGYMLMANLLDTFSVRIQSLLIGKYFNSNALGYYTLAQNTQQAPALFMSGVLNRVGLPIFTIVSSQQERLVDALRKSLRMTMFLFAPCMIGIAVSAKNLIVLLYGERWSPSAPILSVLALSAVFWPMHLLYVAAINAMGRSNSSFCFLLAKRTVMLVLIFASGKFGPMAVAWAVLASAVIGALINSYYSSKFFGYGPVAQFRDQFATMVLSAVAGLVAWLVLSWLPGGTFAMVAATAVAMVVYLSGAALGRHRALADIIGLARGVRAGNAPASRCDDGPDA